MAPEDKQETPAVAKFQSILRIKTDKFYIFAKPIF